MQYKYILPHLNTTIRNLSEKRKIKLKTIVFLEVDMIF